MAADNSLGKGVYYNVDDYPGLMRRICIQLIDAVILVIICAVIAFPFAVAFPMAEPVGLIVASCALAVWIYLAPMRRSKIRTVGYRLMGVKIVSVRGERPSLTIMTIRAGLWLLGPINFLFDLLWLGADTEQQSIRDCLVGTYVVRHDAEPIGSGKMHLSRYTGAGMTLSYPRVSRPAEKT